MALPFTFTPDTVADATQVNANFNAVVPVTGGTMTGALAINPSAAIEPLTMVVPSGGNCRLWQTVTGTREWSVGVFSNGDFHIADETATTVRLTIDIVKGAVALQSLNEPLIMTVPSTGNARVWFNITGLREWSTGVTGTSGKWQIDDQTLPATRFAIDTAGLTYNTSGSWTTLSDRRLKRDIAPYGRGLAAVRQLQPVAFRYNSVAPLGIAPDDARPRQPPPASEDELRYGLIADEVAPIIPEATGTTQVTLPGDKTSTSVATLSPGQLTYALINAVKELADRLEALETRPEPR
jgi:hypothetical protein